MSKTLDYIFVSTDDTKIIDLAKKFGIKTVVRPDHLCGDDATSESALLHAIDVINNKHSIYPEIIVFLQATSPLRLIDDIDNSLNFFIKEKADSLFSVTKLDDLTLWKKDKGKWSSLNFDYKNRLRRQNISKNYIENGSIYIFKPEILKRFNNRIGGKMVTYEMGFWQTWELDSMKEVDLIEFFIKKYNLDQYGIT